MRPSKRMQAGMAVVEFAIVSALLMTTLFVVIEFGRAYFVYNMLEEVTRRGARMASVCQIGDAAIENVAIFGNAGNSTVIPGLASANVLISYHEANGTTVDTSVLPLSDDDFADIAFVRAQIQNFNHQFLVPGLSFIFPTPSFSTTVPRESLGVTRDGLQAC